MTRRSLTLAVLFLILLGTGLQLVIGADAVPAQSTAGEEPTVATADEAPIEDYGTASPRVTGRVLDAEDRPVAGAEVRFTLDRESRLFESLSPVEQQEVQSVRSDAQGAFQIDTLRIGAPYDVVVVRRGFATLLTHFSSWAVGVTPELRLVLRPGKVVRGLILDGKGQPVEGLRIWLHRSTRAGIFTASPLMKVWPDDDLYRTTTGPDGRFEVADLPEQPLDLVIWGSTFAPLVRRGILPSADREMVELGSFRLQPGATYEGLVTDRAGTPIPGAVIGASGQEEPVTESGRDGRFVIHGLSSDAELHLSICRPGYQTVSERFETSTPGIARIVLEPAARVTGKVITPDGAPIAGAEVRASLDGSGRSWSFPSPACPPSDFAQNTTDAQGRFDLRDLAPGPLSLWVMVAGHPKETLTVEAGASAASMTPLTVTLRPGAVLAGRVLDPAGRPVSGATILDDHSLRGHPRTLSGPDGTYRLAGVAAGARSISFLHPDHKETSKTLRIEPGENRFDAVLPRVPRVPVRGHVLGPEGQPLAGARVAVDGDVAAATASDGSFVLLLDREKGSYSLDSQLGAHGPSDWQTVEVAGGRPVDGVEIRLSRGITLTGRIVGITQEELAGATVSAHLLHGASPLSDVFWEAAVDSTGRYRLPGLIPGEWNISVYTGPRDGDAPIVLAAGDEERQLDIGLPELFPVRGRVTGLQGEPVAGALVRFLVSDQARAGAHSEVDGSFSVHLREGTYEVAAEGQDVGYLTAAAPPLVVRGPVEGIEIRLPKGINLRGRLSGFKPLEDISVYAHNESGWRSATVDRDGEYRLAGLPPGAWEVEAYSGVYTATGKVALKAGQDEAELDLAFVPGDLTLSGSIAGAADLPSLLLVLDRPGLGLDVQAEANENGEFRFTRLQSGRYTLTVHGGSGFPTMTEEIEMSTDREVVLSVGPAGGDR